MKHDVIINHEENQTLRALGISEEREEILDAKLQEITTLNHEICNKDCENCDQRLKKSQVMEKIVDFCDTPFEVIYMSSMAIQMSEHVPSPFAQLSETFDRIMGRLENDKDDTASGE